LKKLFALAGTALLIIGLASCSSNSSATPEPTYTPTSEPEPTYTPEPEPTYTKDEIYVATIRSQYSYYASFYSDAELINIASLTCKYFRDGGDFESLAYSLVMSSDSTDDQFYGFMGFTIGAAVATYCPQYSYQVS